MKINEKSMIDEIAASFEPEIIDGDVGFVNGLGELIGDKIGEDSSTMVGNV